MWNVMKITEILKDLPGWYLILIIIRITLTCFPQTGYIHPDEFFQSIEIVVGKVFDVEIRQPWEFNATFPIRSVTLPYLTVGFTYQVLKFLNYFTWNQFKISIITPTLLIVFPRILFCALSFVVDWCLYKICSINSEKFKSRCLVLAASYVMLIYATRTFTNTNELILFSLLLYFVSESVIFSTITVKQREYINVRYKKAKKVVDKVRFHKLRLLIQNDSLRSCFIISTIVTAGFFNRPTFIAYAVGPIFFWLYRGIGFKSVPPLHFHLRILIFVICTIPAVLTFIIIDSFYFGYVTWAEIGMLQISINNFVVTPFNFIKYNINSSNLAQHGLHPRYLHILVNIPLLFSVLSLQAYSNMLDLFAKLIRGKYNYLPTVRSIKGLMITSFIVPLAMLSVFPHQEPRFLVPLILPLVYLYGAKIFPESDDVVVKSFVPREKSAGHRNKSTSYTILKIWIIINALLTIFYGFIHQGGVFLFISNLNNEIRRSNFDKSYQIVTSHIYSVPESLFMQKASTYNDGYLKSNNFKRLIVHEEGSKNLENVLTKISIILKSCRQKHVKYPGCKLYLLLPTSLLDRLDYVRHKDHTNLISNNTITFYPHLSTEALPNIPCVHFKDCLNILEQPITNFVKFIKLFGLARVEFLLKEDSA